MPDFFTNDYMYDFVGYACRFWKACEGTGFDEEQVMELFKTFCSVQVQRESICDVKYTEE